MCFGQNLRLIMYKLSAKFVLYNVLGAKFQADYVKTVCNIGLQATYCDRGEVWGWLCTNCLQHMSSGYILCYGRNLRLIMYKLSANYVLYIVLGGKFEADYVQTVCNICPPAIYCSRGEKWGWLCPNCLQHIRSSYNRNLRSRPAFGRPRIKILPYLLSTSFWGF